MKMYLFVIISSVISQLASAQNTGIGTVAPRARLHIKGNADTSQLVIDANAIQSNAKPLVRLRTAAGVDLVHIHSDNPINTFIGLDAGKFNTISGGSNGLANTFIGSRSGANNSTGYSLTAVGKDALFSNTTGTDNTAVGAIALYYNKEGYYNTAIGRGALYQNTIGNENTSIGFKSLFSNTDGFANTAIGSQALVTNIGGAANTAIGSNSLYRNSEGTGNTAVGRSSLFENTLGGYNTGMGSSSLSNNTVGNNNTAVGYVSLGNNINGTGNTSIGASALLSNNSGNYNTAVGNFANSELGTGNNNTMIGFNARVLGSNSTVVGSDAYTTSSNIALLGSTTTQYCGGYVNWTNYVSDGRLKKSVNEEVRGLDFIMRLRPVTYHIDVRGIYQKWGISPYDNEDKKMNASSKADIDESIRSKEAIRMSGFIAQEVEIAAQQSGYDFDGVKKPSNDKDNYGLSYATFVVPLVKAVQELSNMNTEKDKRIAALEARLQRLENRLPVNN